MRNNASNNVREPLFHITKRSSINQGLAWAIRIVSVLAALVLCGLITFLLTGENPISVYETMLKGAFGSERKIWVLGQNMAILLCVSLAVTPAFKMRFWNIGAEGQVLMGGLATAACMILFGGKFPPYILFPIMIVASIAAGIIWGIIPAFFKAFWNTNETLFTLMMNYVAMQIVSYFCYIWSVPKGSGHIGEIPNGAFPPLFGQKYLLNIVVVLVITIFMYIYFKYSKHGYEISVVGESENTAKYIGINVKKVIIRTMILSGAICGIAGLLLVGGTSHTIDRETAGGRGFTAIMVSWLAHFNPLYMILTSFIIVFFERGASQISTDFGFNDSFSEILTGIIIFFIIGSEFFINYKINFRKKEDK